MGAWQRFRTLFASQTPAPPIGERTGRQVVTSGAGLGTGGPKRLPASYDTYRQMRKHPTVALARALSVAPIVAAEWSVEADDDAPEDAVQFVQDQFLAIREPLLETALLGGIDFGHQAFEKVFAWDPDLGLIVLKKLKPLLQDITEILVDECGRFVGLKQSKVVLPLQHCLLFSFRVEGTDWYGTPLLENARETWNDWRDANRGAARYDRKVAGVHWVVRYPLRQETDQTGRVRESAEMAQEMLATLEASGSVAVANEPTMGDPMNPSQQWLIELLEDAGGRQPTFIDRLRYLDSLLARATLIPERSVLEGQYGTKAEAGEQIDMALTHADLMHRHVTRLVNWHAVDQLLAINWGDEYRGTVRLVAAPIRDAKLQYVREVYATFLANPSGFLEEAGQIDTDAIKDLLGVPKAKEVAQAGTGPAALPLPGVDANSPVAATVRKIYANLGKTAGVQGNGRSRKS